MSRRVGVYFSWDRLAEQSAQLGVLDNRFPALFEARRMQWPALETLADPNQIDQGISGFLDNVFLKNFELFPRLAESWTQRAVQAFHRRTAAGQCLLDSRLLANLDTLIIISFDSQRTMQAATGAEVEAIKEFLADPKHAVFVSPHHDIGDTDELSGAELIARQALEHEHHGDRAIPPQQRFGGFALSLMARLGLPIRNRYGLRPALAAEGAAALIEVAAHDRFGLLTGLSALNQHPHLPHFERCGASTKKLEVLVRQRIDPEAPPHPFTQDGKTHFDAVLQAAPGVVAGCLVVTDATLWNSASGPQDRLETLWRNVVLGSW